MKVMFKEFDIHKKIREECEKDPEFKAMYEKVKADNDLVWELIQARKRENLTQEELAQKTGIKQQSISRLERFDTKPNLNTVEKIALALGYKLTLKKEGEESMLNYVCEDEDYVYVEDNTVEEDEPLSEAQIKKQVEYWINTSEHDYKTMQKSYQSKSYDWCLFLGYLVIEKLLKAVYVRENRQYAPRIHNLLLLAQKSNMSINAEIRKALMAVTEFNIEARYPDFIKSFYEQCTKEYTDINMLMIEELRLWLQKFLSK
ncbi:MAG TPA: hypothetical protein DCP90_06375 [Clostridiales bacterium]|nr:hypothetical protein [Clostridiales bacterium]